VHVKLGDASFAIAVGLEDALLEAVPDPERRAAAASTGAAETRITTTGSASEAPAAPPSGGSKTFDLLLDVELPVSVSFGRTRIPLKDVLKLSTGSIVELNRNVNEPVEIIVNNCVIARGEVVVVEGNFGVRIQEVISRQERLRTLQ
jgi:flagellar motor switch protein FliN/FliY